MIEYYTMNNRFIPLVNLPETYKAYLYIVVFQHNKSMKYYFGYHEGLFDGTYKGTPKAHEEEFKSHLLIHHTMAKGVQPLTMKINKDFTMRSKNTYQGVSHE